MKKDQEFNGSSVDKWIASRLFLGCAGCLIFPIVCIFVVTLLLMVIL